jgi:hypothetical protein
MPKPLTTRAMSDSHEIFLAHIFGGRRSINSGAQANDQADGRNRRYDTVFPAAWDGKATMGKSHSITLETWDKLVEQSHGEHPILALRWYADERLHVRRDLVVLDAHDLAELLEGYRNAR